MVVYCLEVWNRGQLCHDCLCWVLILQFDGFGMGGQAAVEACYQIMPTVQRLWKPIFGEFDDYIVHPKPSGYQSLHTAVIGPDRVPMEVQIRTSSMHHEAEYGQAAHWAYKDAPPAPQQPPPKPDLSVGKAVRAWRRT